MTEAANGNTPFITEYIKQFLGLNTVLDSLWLEFETSKILNPDADSWIISKEYKDTVDELNFLVVTYVNYIKRGLSINDALNIVKTNYDLWQCSTQCDTQDTSVPPDTTEQILHSGNPTGKYSIKTAKSYPHYYPHIDSDVNVEHIYHNPHMTGQYLARNQGIKGEMGPTGAK